MSSSIRNGSYCDLFSLSAGHGFGLPHTDENPNNSDLGNCLDYTNRPENNQLPGEVNFQRLRSIYIAGENGKDNTQGGDAQGNDNDNQGDRIQGDQGRLLRKRSSIQYPHRVIVQYFLYDSDVQEALN